MKNLNNRLPRIVLLLLLAIPFLLGQTYGTDYSNSGSDAGAAVCGGIFWLVVLGVFISICSTIAKKRGRSSAWGLMGFFGLIGVLVVALLPKTEQAQEDGAVKKCPKCAETIKEAAQVCHYCKARFKINKAGHCRSCNKDVWVTEQQKCPECNSPVKRTWIVSEPIESGEE